MSPLIVMSYPEEVLASLFLLLWILTTGFGITSVIVGWFAIVMAQSRTTFKGHFIKASCISNAASLFSLAGMMLESRNSGWGNHQSAVQNNLEGYWKVGLVNLFLCMLSAAAYLCARKKFAR